MPGQTGLALGPEGTIYEKEKGFDDNLRIEIEPTKIQFIKELKRSDASSIFHVNYDGNLRVLKVVCTSHILESLTSFLTMSSSITTRTLAMPTMGSVT
jgi:hypothetical protein